jgi:hypothetical protein
MKTTLYALSLAMSVSFNSANRANNGQDVWGSTRQGGWTDTHSLVLWRLHRVAQADDYPSDSITHAS